MLHIDWQEKVSDFFNIVTTADRNLINKNTANTSSLTWRGCVMIFEPETCFYVPYSRDNKHLFENKHDSKIFENKLFDRCLIAVWLQLDRC